MSKSRVVGVCLSFATMVFSSLSVAATPDRITGDLASGPKVQIANLSPVRPENDLGRADAGRVIEHLSLDFRLSPAQQKDLDQFLAQLADRNSPNFHKYLTIPQYAKRFGMSQNDLNKVVTWLESQGFTNIKVANNHNSIKFDGTVAQIESAFALEMHHYLVDGVVHLANAGSPSLPAALAGIVTHVGHLHDFAPKPRVQVRPNLTSYVSGNHFLSPGDFAAIYDLKNLYAAGADGTGQKIAIVGQTTVSTTDLSNFRSAAGLPASSVTMDLMEGTAARCSGDEGESDLDLEWSGGVAKGAQITFIYAGLGPGDTCSNRFDSVWDALEDALTGTTTGVAGHPVAPFVSTSYGFCEQGLNAQDPTFIPTVRGWVQTGQTLGVTLVSASGDAGAADCDPSNSPSAQKGLAVDIPASIPETTGAGGNEFVGDAAGTVTGAPPNTTAGATLYWGASGTGSDVVSTALGYIPEGAWNDTMVNLANGGGLASSGGGASDTAITSFTKPTWQNVTGVPSANARYVPDISLTASADHDGYLFCSEDAGTGTCSSGFRTGAGGSFTIVGGTSAVAPTFTAILALINQYLGNPGTTGLAPVNPMLYSLYPNNATSGAFNDITSGSNIVPCTSGTTGCPATAPFSYGFNTNAGYDEVTGLGSVNGFHLAQAWLATLGNFTLTSTPLNPTSVSAGNSTTSTVTVAPTGTFTGTVSFSCVSPPNGVTCSFNPATVTNGTGTTTMTIQTSPTTAAATTTVTVKGTSGSLSQTSSVSLTVTATTETFSITSNLSGGSTAVAQGQTTGSIALTVNSTSTPSFIVSSGSGQQTAAPVVYTCTGLPSESTCLFNGTANTVTSSMTSVTLTIQTTAPTTKLQPPLDRGMKIFYAILLPGMLGIVFVGSFNQGSRKRALGGTRMLGLIVVLGFSTLWMGACGGGSSGTKNPGTPAGSYPVTVNAVTQGSAPITGTPVLTFNLNVTP